MQEGNKDTLMEKVYDKPQLLRALDTLQSIKRKCSEGREAS